MGHALMGSAGQRGENDEVGRLGKTAHLVAGKRRDVVGHIDARTAMVDTRRGTENDGEVMRLGNLEGGLRHEIRLFRRGGIKHGDMGELSELTRVLLGLAGNGTGIVGNDNDHTAARAHI